MLKYYVENSVDQDQTPHSAASDLGLHRVFRSIYSNIYMNTVDVYDTEKFP